MTATIEDAPVEVPPQTNRAMRRQKGRMFNKADFRKWQAEAIKNKLFTKQDETK